MAISDLFIPTLDTPRLILRGHKLEDFNTMVQIWQDPIVVRHFHGEPLSREDIWSRFLRGFGMWLVSGYGLWAVEEKETHAYVGTVGIFDVKRDMNPPVEDMPEAGWTFASHAHGKGYATEAMTAALAWTDATLANPRMFCIIAPQNLASIRVAEKCGFKPAGETTYKDEPTLVFLRPGR